MAEGNTVSGAKKKSDLADFVIAIACALGIATTLLFLALLPVSRHLAGARDYVIYWATGQQLTHHANPYDPDQMRQLEHSAGFAGQASLVNYMRNPPWGLPLALPLGFLSAHVAALPWSLLMLALLILCVRILWKMFGQPSSHQAGSHLDWLGYCFPPALICVIMGQTSLFLLLGMVLFLRLHRTQPFWAGAALWFCTLKPHLFVPFGIALLLWIIVTRKYRIVLGALAALAFSCGITTLIDPSAWSQYAHWAHTSGVSNEFLPCLGVALRNLINPNIKWLAFVPCAVGSIWVLDYFRRHHEHWDWMEHGSLVMLVSILVAPYCWFYDQSLAIPALLFAACRTQSRTLLAVLGLLYLAVEIQPLFSPAPETALYLWTAPAWLLWFLVARGSIRSGATAQYPVVAGAAL
jgi:hypothetical protein